MNVYAPVEVKQADLKQTEVQANVFAASKKSKVEMQIGNGAWMAMQPVLKPDPVYVVAKEKQDKDALPTELGRKLPEPSDCPHLWSAHLPTNLAPGTHVVSVRTTDLWNRTFEECRVVRVVA